MCFMQGGRIKSMSGGPDGAPPKGKQREIRQIGTPHWLSAHMRQFIFSGLLSEFHLVVMVMVMKMRRSCGFGPSPLTVLRVVGAAAVAANVLDFFPDVTVDVKGHVVVVVVMVPPPLLLLLRLLLLGLLAVSLLAAQRHDFDQAERLLLGFLHRYGRVFSAARHRKPGAVHDARRGVNARVTGRLKHRGPKIWRKKSGGEKSKTNPEVRPRL